MSCDICELCNINESAEHLTFGCHTPDGIRNSFALFILRGLLDLFAKKGTWTRGANLLY